MYVNRPFRRAILSLSILCSNDSADVRVNNPRTRLTNNSSVPVSVLRSARLPHVLSLLSIEVPAGSFRYIRRRNCRLFSTTSVKMSPTFNPTPRFLSRPRETRTFKLFIGQIYSITLLSSPRDIETSSRLSPPNHGSII